MVGRRPMRDRLAGRIIGTNVAPPKPRRDVEWGHRNNLLYCRFIEGPFLRHGQLRIPKSRLTDNAVSSGKVLDLS